MNKDMLIYENKTAFMLHININKIIQYKTETNMIQIKIHRIYQNLLLTTTKLLQNYIILNNCNYNENIYFLHYKYAGLIN